MRQILAEPEEDDQRQHDLQKDEDHDDGESAEKQFLQQSAFFLVEQFYDVILFHGSSLALCAQVLYHKTPSLKLTKSSRPFIIEHGRPLLAIKVCAFSEVLH